MDNGTIIVYPGTASSPRGSMQSPPRSAPMNRRLLTALRCTLVALCVPAMLGHAVAQPVRTQNVEAEQEWY